MSKEVLDILERIGAERNVSVEQLHRSLEEALVSASRKVLGNFFNVSRCALDEASGQFRVYALKQVVEEAYEDEIEIDLSVARELQPDCQVGDEVEVDVTPDDFGRIAAQSAKQVMAQRIRELEREMIYDRYRDRIGDLVAGTVQRYDRGNVIVDLGSAEALLPPAEQAALEKYHYGDKLKAIIVDVRRSARDQQIILSRRSPLLVVKLFDQEVNEIRESVVRIHRIAREAGKRSKIAVISSDSNVDPVGACVGIKGSRVQMVVQELRGERIDIIEFSSDQRRFVANSLKPAEVLNVDLLDEKHALVQVRDAMLSLAIGKQGLNAKLASELTGVEMHVVSDLEYQEQEDSVLKDLMRLEAITEEVAQQLVVANVFCATDLLEIEDPLLLTQIEGVDEALAHTIMAQAQALIEADALALERGEEVGSSEPVVEPEAEAAAADDVPAPDALVEESASTPDTAETTPDAPEASEAPETPDTPDTPETNETPSVDSDDEQDASTENKLEPA